jgi:hypothetical protein
LQPAVLISLETFFVVKRKVSSPYGTHEIRIVSSPPSVLQYNSAHELYGFDFAKICMKIFDRKTTLSLLFAIFSSFIQYEKD